MPHFEVGGDGIFGGTITTVGNSTLVEYKHYNDSDFFTTTNLQWDTIAISEHETGTSDRAGYAEFHLYDNTTNADSTILVFSVSKLTSNSVAINVKEINWNTSSQCIEGIRVKFGSTLSNRRAEIQINHRRLSNSGDPTSIDIKMYTNLSKTDFINDVLPWKLSSDNQTYSNNITEIDLTNNNGNKISSATNLYKYFDKGIMLGNDINLNSNDIDNINQLKGTNNYINFNNSGNLRLNAQNILEFGTANPSVYITYSGNILTFNGSNGKIDNLTGINQTTGDITIGNPNNNVLIDASQVEIKSKDGGAGGGGDIILNNSGGGNGSIIFKNGATALSGDVTYKANNFDLSNNILKVDEMESSTTNEIKINSDLDLNLNDIQKVANLNITGTNLTIGTLNSRVNFKSMTNMFVDSSSNVSSKLTTVGDLAICNSPVSQKGIVFANSNSLNTVIKKFQVSTGTAIYYSFNDMTNDVTLGLNGGSGTGNTSYIYYYNSKFLGSAHTNSINGPSWTGSSGSTANPIIANGSTSGYTLPFWGSLDALLINGFENSLIAGHTAGSKNYKFRLSIGVWAGTSYNAPGVRFIGEYDIDTSVLPNATLLNLTDAVFTRDQTMIKSGINLQPSGLPTSPNTPTNWFNSNNEPINWGVISGSTSNIQRIGVVIKLENTSSGPVFPQTIKWEKPTMGVQTFLKMDVPWNIP